MLMSDLFKMEMERYSCDKRILGTAEVRWTRHDLLTYLFTLTRKICVWLCVTDGGRIESSIPLTTMTTTTSRQHHQQQQQQQPQSTSQTQSSTSLDDNGHHVYINSSVSVSGRATRTPTWRRLHLVDSELDQQVDTVEQTSQDDYQRLDLSVLETHQAPEPHDYVNVSPSSPDMSQGVDNTGPDDTNQGIYERLDPARFSRHEYASISTLQTTGSEAHGHLEPITLQMSD